MLLEMATPYPRCHFAPLSTGPAARQHLWRLDGHIAGRHFVTVWTPRSLEQLVQRSNQPAVPAGWTIRK
jgi:hypothetical protein